MHRMKILLSAPSTSWDRKLDEGTLFELTLNKCNVEETDKFIEILDQEAATFFEYMYKKAADDFVTAHQLLNSKDSSKISEGMRTLNGIITRAPYDSPVLPNAIKMRGNYFFHKCWFEAASMDFEMFLYIGSKTNDAEELCEVNGNLVITYYLNRQYQKSKQRLTMFNNYIAIIPKNNLKKPNFERIIRHISNFAFELDNVEDIVPTFTDDVDMYIPFKGFNTSEDMTNTSSALQKGLIGKNFGVFSNCTIPAGSVVLVEHSDVQGVDSPFTHCELCLHYKQHIYTCLKCRYKTYCSLKCMLKDEERHRNECDGYKNLLLITLEAVSLYNIFIRVSRLLHEQIFDLKVFRKITTATAVLEKLRGIIEKRDMQGIQYLNLLITKPDYYKLSEMQYSTFITTVFRLTIFIEKKTHLIDSFYKKLRLSNKQKMIVVGSILMRLNFHLITNSFDFELKYPQLKSVGYHSIQRQVKQMSYDIQPVRGVINDVYKYYNINIENDILKNTCVLLRKHRDDFDKSNTVEMNFLCSPILRQLSKYKDEIAELYFKLKDSKDISLFDRESEISTKFICKRMNILGELERYKFVQVFARCFHRYLVEYFMQKNLDNYLIQVITILCTTLGIFRNSCDPNMEVFVMENGQVIGKTLRDINNGEELLVSYKPHYTRHTKAERKKYLRQINLDCKCKYCELEDKNEPINVRLGIYCNSCNYKITPANEKCGNCQKQYNHLLSKYITECDIITEELNEQKKKKANERKLYILHLMSNIHVCQCFVPSNEIRIRSELKYAKFLALKNLGKQSFGIVQEIKQTLLNEDHMSFIWFTLYADVLEILKILLYYNIDKGLHSISNNDLEHVCDYGLFIIKGQLRYIRLYQTFDYESAPIYHDLHAFKKWKEKIWYASFSV